MNNSSRTGLGSRDRKGPRRGSEKSWQVGDAIRREKALSKDTEATLRQGIEAYKKSLGK